MTSEKILGDDRAKWGTYILDNLQVRKELVGPAFYRMVEKIKKCREDNVQSAQQCCKIALDTARQLDRSPYRRKYSWGIQTRFIQGVFYVCEGVVRLDAETPGATDCFEESLKVFSENHARQRSIALLGQGLVEHLAGNADKAITCYQLALDMVSRIIEVEEQSPLEQKLSELIEKATDLLLDPKSTQTKAEPQPSKPEAPSPLNAKGKIVPVFERIAASDDFFIAEENIHDYKLIDPAIANRIDFGLVVDGDSMCDAAILEGDIVLMEHRKDPPPNGQIVAAFVIQVDTNATLKRFYDEGDHIRLKPENDDYPHIIILGPNSRTEDKIRTHYKKNIPPAKLRFYRGVELQITGWAVAIIREEIP